MPDILADYREWRQQQAGRVSTHSDGCHMWHKDCMIHRLAAALAVEMAKRTLTDAEREAVEYFSQWCIGPSERLKRYEASLRGLLERTRP